MTEYKNLSHSTTLCFSPSKIAIDEKTLTISVIITAVLAKYMSPGSVRVYRIIRMSDAFWTVRMRRLHALMPYWPPVVFSKNK